jgi:hypothetical protein
MSSGDPTAGGAPAMGPQPGSPEHWLMLLQQFADEMNSPLDMNDPMVSNILQGARTSTMASLQDRGIQGGYSQNQAERSYIGAAAGLQQQRRQLGLQALNVGQGASSELLKQRYNMSRDSHNDLLKNYQWQDEQNQGLGSLIGGGLGGLLGGAGGFFLGGPAGAAAGAQTGFQAGSSIGRGIGGMNQPPPPTFSYKGYGGV